MTTPPSPPSGPFQASPPSAQEDSDDPLTSGVPVCLYHHLRFLQQSNQSQDEPGSNYPSTQPNTSVCPTELVDHQSTRTELSSEEMCTLSHAGIEYSRHQFRDQGFPFPEADPFIPMIQETVNTRAAIWRAGVQILYPSLEGLYLDKIESDTKLGIVYDFLALYLQHRTGMRSDFPTHEANPAA